MGKHREEAPRRSSGFIWSKEGGVQFITEIDPKKQFAYIKVSGCVSPRIFREALMNSFWDDDFDPTFTQLIDLSEIEGYPVIDDAEDVSGVFRSMRNILKGKIAILAPNTVVLTIAHLVSYLARKEGMELEVFQSLDKAKEWLGVG